MVKLRVQLRNVSNVAASKTALIELPVGPRYHNVILQHGYASGTNTIAAACTNISEIRVKVNGRVQRTYSGTQLRDINILNGTAYDCQGAPNTAPGVSVPIFFAEPWRNDNPDKDALAWPTEGWQSFQIEVDLGAASTPTLVASAVLDSFVPPKPAGIVKVIRQSFNASGTSFDISTLDRRDFLQSISFYPDSGGSNACTKVTFRRNGVILHELSNTANSALLINSGMTPAASGRTANVYDVVLDHDDLLGSAVPMDGTRDVTLTLEAGSAMSGTITALIQRDSSAEQSNQQASDQGVVIRGQGARFLASGAVDLTNARDTNLGLKVQDIKGNVTIGATGQDIAGRSQNFTDTLKSLQETTNKTLEDVLQQQSNTVSSALTRVSDLATSVQTGGSSTQNKTVLYVVLGVLLLIGTVFYLWRK